MGVDGCEWVRMGAVGCRGTEGTKTRQAKTKMVVNGVCFGAMAGEISPNIMFCDGRQKVERMGVDG